MESIHFNFTNLDDEDFKTLVNAPKYKKSLQDFEKWIEKEQAENPYYDKETLEFVHDKFLQILMDYNL